MQYELFYLIGEREESNLDTIKKEIEGIVTKEGGKFVDVAISEKRKMAYEIKHQYRGIYTAQRFETAGKDEDSYDPEIISKITRQMNLYQNILRFVIVKSDELPPLKTKEERSEEQKKPLTKKVEKIVEKVKEKIEEVKEDIKKEEPKDDSIDKQLEEILKI